MSRKYSDNRLRHIYTTLRERICMLDYAPGERLSEAGLAAEFSVSRTPIRHVLGKLETEGLVTTRHGVGNFVTAIEPAYLCEVYRLRMELVLLIGQLSPVDVTEAFLERARTLQAQCQNINADPQLHAQAKSEFARINMTFFELLMELVGNRPLRETLENLFYLSARMWPYLMDDSTVLEESERFAHEIGDVIYLLERGGINSLGYLRRTQIEMALQRLKQMLSNRDEAYA